MTNEKLHEECGVIGIISAQPLHMTGLCSSALLALQHRGQESAGIATFTEGKLKCKKGLGLVTEVFNSDYLEYSPNTKVAVGHVRYSTTGTCNVENAQPIETVHPKLSMALAHNGNLTNSGEIRNELVQSGMILHTTNDTEIINILIIKYMLEFGDVEKAVEKAMSFIEGAFSIVIATKDKLIAVRDRNGFRPLCMGRLSNNAVVFASETCALDAIGATRMPRAPKYGAGGYIDPCLCLVRWQGRGRPLVMVKAYTGKWGSMHTVSTRYADQWAGGEYRMDAGLFAEKIYGVVFASWDRDGRLKWKRDLGGHPTELPTAATIRSINVGEPEDLSEVRI